MRETEMVQRIRQLSQAGHRDPRILKGIGDDCAILRPRANEDLVFTTDFVVEDRHFALDTHRPADIGHKALARSLSDLAAMGAEPLFCLVSLAIPAHLGPRWLPAFYKGLLALAARYNITVAGGDLSKSDKVVADVMCCGRVPRGTAMLRSAAKPGDRIYVTGTLGASAKGFTTRRGANWKRHLRPTPRIEAGLALRRKGVRCAMDLSDGLSLDLQRLCLESNLGAQLDPHLPIAPGATSDQALHGGEDYELLFTTPKKMPKALAGLPISSLGVMTVESPGRIRLSRLFLTPKGFDHFRPL